MNQTIKQIHDLLVDQIDGISNEMDTNTDPVRSKKLLLELNEITHRLNIAQNVMMVQTSKGLTNSLPAINSASGQLSKSLKQAQNVAGFLNDATQFLKLVDQALDLAKTLAIF